ANRAVPGPYGPHRRAFSVSSVALAYAAAGRPDDARAAATGAIEEAHNTYLDRASAYAAIGFAESQQGSLDGAEEAFARALAEAQGVTAVDADDLAGDPAALGPGQVPHRAGDVVGGSEPADRHLGQVVVADVVVADEGRGQVGRHQPGPHPVDPDAGGAQLVG